MSSKTILAIVAVILAVVAGVLLFAPGPERTDELPPAAVTEAPPPFPAVEEPVAAAGLEPEAPPPPAEEPEPEVEFPEPSATPDREAGVFRITGRVLYPDESPAANVPVRVHGQERGGMPGRTREAALVTTAEDGTFVASVESDPDFPVYLLEAEVPGYTHHEAQVVDNEAWLASLPEGVSPPPEEHLRPSFVTIRIMREGFISGRMLFEDGRPAPGLDVGYGQMPQLPEGERFSWGANPSIGQDATGEAGEFRFEGLAHGPVHLAAGHEGVILGEWELEVPAEDIELTVKTPPELPRLSGRVYHAESGLAQPDVGLRFEWVGGPSRPGFSPPMRFGPEGEMVFSPKKQMSLGARRAASVGQPGEGADMETVSGPGGRYELADVPWGRYRVHIETEGLLLESLDIDVPDGYPRGFTPTEVNIYEDFGSTVTLDIHVHGGSELRGRAVDAGRGNPLPGRTVHLQQWQGRGHEGIVTVDTATTDARGRFSFSGVDTLTPHVLRVEGVRADQLDLGTGLGGSWATLGDYPGVGVPPMALRGQEEVILRIRPMGTLTVVVQRADRSPVPDAEVSASPRHGRASGRDMPNWQPTNRAGRVSFPVVVGNEYFLEARSYLDGSAAHESVRARDDGETLLVLGRPGTVAGTVVDQDGRAVARAEVRLSTQQQLPRLPTALRDDPSLGPTPGGAVHNQVVQSNADGRFRFDNVLPGAYRVFATHAELGTGQIRGVEIRDGEERTGLEIRLQKPSERAEPTQPEEGAGFTLRGRVVDEEGDPLAGVQVRAHGFTVMELIETGGDGHFSIEGVPARPGHISLHKQGYAAESHMLPFRVRDEVQTFSMMSLAERTLFVTVLAADTGRPVEDLEVFRTNQTFQIQWEDSGSIEILPAGFSHALSNTRGDRPVHVYYRATAPGYGTGYYDFRLEPGEMVAEREVELPLPGMLSGRLVDGVTGEPAAGLPVLHFPGISMVIPRQASIRVRPEASPAASSVSDSSGRFLFPEVPAGEGTIRVDLGGEDMYSDFSYEFSSESHLDMGDLVLGPYPEVAVHLVDRDTGDPLAGREVTFTPRVRVSERGYRTLARQEGFTDEAGRAAFGPQVTPDGTFRTEGGSKFIEIPQEPGVHEFTMEIGQAAIGIRIVSSPGSPASTDYSVMPSARVGETRYDGARRPGEDGIYWTEGLPAGEAHFRTTLGFHDIASGTAPARTSRLSHGWTVELESGERKVLDLELPTAVIHGRIDVPENYSAEDFEVTLRVGGMYGIAVEGWSGERFVFPQPDGAYRIAGVPPGEHTLSVSHPEFGETRTVNVPEGEGVSVEEDFSFNTPTRGTLRITAVDAVTGEPIPNAFSMGEGIGDHPRLMVRHDGEGVLVVEGVDSGSHEVITRGTGYHMATFPYDITPEQTTHLRVELTPR